jgi:hypothetical protein
VGLLSRAAPAQLEVAKEADRMRPYPDVSKQIVI